MYDEASRFLQISNINFDPLLSIFISDCLIILVLILKYFLQITSIIETLRSTILKEFLFNIGTISFSKKYNSSL